MQKPSTLKRTAGKDQSATQSVIETNRPAIRRTQNTSSSESKPGLNLTRLIILWVHRFQKTHEDQPGRVYSTPAILNYRPKFRSERCHCRDLMSPLRRTKQIQASCITGQGKTCQGIGGPADRRVPASDPFRLVSIVVPNSRCCRRARSNERKCRSVG